MGRKTKALIEVEKIDELVEAERIRLLEIMRVADIYTVILDPLIESYLETFRVYKLMYKRWSDKGFPATTSHTNKNGAKNVIKHPLSVQVDVWSERKLKALEKLGMTNKALSQKVVTGGTTVDTSTGTAEKEVDGEAKGVNKLKQKWGK